MGMYGKLRRIASPYTCCRPCLDSNGWRQISGACWIGLAGLRADTSKEHTFRINAPSVKIAVLNSAVLLQVKIYEYKRDSRVETIYFMVRTCIFIKI